MSVTTWVWMAAASVLVVAEILSLEFVLLPFATGAASAAAASALGADAGIQWVAFLVVSAVVMVVLQRFVARRRTR